MKYSDLEEALSYFRKAAELLLIGKPKENRHITLKNLGSALLQSLNYKENKTDINEAIDILHTAIDIAPAGHIQIPNHMVNLGICLCAGYQQRGSEKDVEEAISVHPLMSLGKDFEARYNHIKDLADLEEAIIKFRQAALSPTGPLSMRLQVSRRWIAGSVIIDPMRTMDAFNTAIQLQARVAGKEQIIAARYSRLMETKYLPTTAAAVAIKTGLRTPVDELKGYDEGLAEDVVRVSRGLEKAGSRGFGHLPVITEDTKYMAHRISEQAKVISHLELAEEWDQLLAKVRTIPRFKDFLRPPRCTDLLSDLPKSGIVVMITAHQDELKVYDSCDALVLVPGSEAPRHIPLKGFSYNRGEVLRKNLLGHLRGHGLGDGPPCGWDAGGDYNVVD
ncbi:hypothetical protein CPB84DRAFT_1850430 [Gymnopilus junonius]|uniref:Uncharacterized protein n=1 Tax=Gymnopilus junonius TaxID=109634 RepID=A0A9P5NFV5_GYMJU|nr:hypothetical protein CPB84DRAFT_1850430 [Gymnopilus junonius]